MTKKKSHQKKAQAEQTLYDNVTKTLLQFMASKRYKPMEESALLEKLHVHQSLYPLCRRILKDLEEKQVIKIHKQKIGFKKEEGEILTGILRIHPRGFGFLVPDDPEKHPQDIFIPRHLTDTAVDGDRVEVAINPHAFSEKGPEGAVLTILQRGRTHLAGTISHIGKQGEGPILVHVPLLGVARSAVIEEKGEYALRVGDRVILQVLDWGDQMTAPRCEVSHYIGHISDPSFDIQAAVEEFALRSSFPQEVVAEAQGFGLEVLPKDLLGRLDLSQIETFTIDPETARDYDDALSLSKNEKGEYLLGVHIADVSHYIAPGSALDKEALERCNSTYFPGTCLPMLPGELSNQLCSLHPYVIRLTVSVLMTFDQVGTLLNYSIKKAYIKSAHRFTYTEAKEVIDHKKKSPHEKTLALMLELCHLLKKKRNERGSIDFGLPEVILKLDEKGQPTGVEKVEYDISHQLVEEFMLKANEVVAIHLAKQEVPLLYRIHEEPTLENLEEFFAQARHYGFSLPIDPTQEDIQLLFEKIKGAPESGPLGQQLAVSFIRSMKLASYSSSNVGHYGLALEHYCHFTSPIRRYSDLIIHRLLFSDKEPIENLDRIAVKCSEQERISFRAEQSVKLLKKLRLLKTYWEEDPNRQYQGIITRIKPFGLCFELPDLMIEGFLHISELADDFFLFDPQRTLFRGKTTGILYRIGQSITVTLQSVDFILLESKWALYSLPSKPRKKRR